MGTRRWWCCGGAAKDEEEDDDDSSAAVEASIEARNAAVVSIGGLETAARRRGIGLLIHPSLFLTTHSTVPDAACLRHAKLTLCRSSSSSRSTFVTRRPTPHLFFRTDAELDLTLVSCELVEPDIASPICAHGDAFSAAPGTRPRRRRRHLHRHIFVMGCLTRRADDIALARGIVLSGASAATPPRRHRESFVRFAAGADLWMPGSAGFDETGALAFIVTKTVDSVDYGTGGKNQAAAEPWPAQWGTCISAIRRWIQPLWLEEASFLHHLRPPVAAMNGQHHPSAGGCSTDTAATETTIIRHAGNNKEHDADLQAKTKIKKNKKAHKDSASMDTSVQTDGDLMAAEPSTTTDVVESEPISVRPIAVSVENYDRICSDSERRRRRTKGRAGGGGRRRRRERWNGDGGIRALQDLQMNVVNGIREARSRRCSSVGRGRSGASSRASTPSSRRRSVGEECWGDRRVAAVDVAYSKPTISSMQKLSMERRRDSAAWRTPGATPRWM